MQSRRAIRWAALILVMASAVSEAAEVITFHGYRRAVLIQNKTTRVVLCPEVGGRVLEYSLNGRNVLYLSDAEKNWKPGDRPQSSAGRFDIGPEYIVPGHSSLWTGPWKARIDGPLTVTLTSQQNEATGVTLIRRFTLSDTSSHLSCRQTIVNQSDAKKEWCHWSRTFAVGQGVCVIPMTSLPEGPQSRFPKGYVMYEGRGLINVLPSDPNIRQVGGTLQIFPAPAHPKLGFDSYVGEIMYAAPNDLLFIKRFPTFPDRVYNEAAGLTISVWYPDREMVELEPIGPRETLMPGESASFTEDWWLGKFEFPGTADDVSLEKLQDTAARVVKP